MENRIVCIAFALIILAILLTLAREEKQGFKGRYTEKLTKLYNDDIVPLLVCFLQQYDKSEYLQKTYKINAVNNDLPTEEEKEHVRKFISNVIERLEIENIYETLPAKGSTSYTVDKGKEMYICAEDTDGTPHEFDLIKFVFVHELAHVGSEEWGHEDVFWAEFRFLMQLLCEYNCNLHEHTTKFKHCGTNFAEKGKEERYCGMNINYNPVFDRDAKTF